MLALGVILLGPPGAGKGTQAKRIERDFGLPHIAMGDMLREAVRSGSGLGRQAEAYMERGELVPDSVIDAVAFERLRQPDCKKGFLLDGFPRSVPQAEALDAELLESGKSIKLVLVLQVDDSEVLRRAQARWICRSCNRPFARQPGATKEERCEACGGELYQRSDDQPETVRRRLEVYRAWTAPVIEYYRQRGVVGVVDGSGTVDEVYGRVRGELERSRTAAGSGD